MNKLTEKKDLHDQVHHLEKLVDRLQTAMGLAIDPEHAMLYTKALRELITSTRMTIAMGTDKEAQAQIGHLREFVVLKINECEDNYRRKAAELDEIRMLGVRIGATV
jgi:hypothetical protein